MARAVGCADLRPDPRSDLRAGRICELPDSGELTVWLPRPPSGELEVQVDGKPSQVATATRAAGLLATVHTGTRARRLEVSDRRARWTLELEPAEADPALRGVKQLRAAGEYDAAEAALKRAPPETDPVRAAKWKGLEARLALSRGRIDAAVARFEEAIALDRRAGRWVGEFRDRAAMAYALIVHRRELGRGKEVLDAVEPLFGEVPEAVPEVEYYRGLVGWETGDYRTAMQHLRRSIAGAEALGVTDIRDDAAMMLTDVLQKMERHEDAMALIAEALDGPPPQLDACGEAVRLNNLGLSLLVARASERFAPGQVRDPLPLLERSAELLRERCPEPGKVAGGLATLAQAHLEAGRWQDARAIMAEARRRVQKPPIRSVLEWMWIDARAALAAGSLEPAREKFEALAVAGKRTGILRFHWGAVSGTAQVLEAQGRLREALAAYEEAERVLDDQGSFVPLGEGREGFLSARDHNARRYLDLLLRMGREREALAIARRSRARLLRSVDWRAGVDRLSPEARAQWYASAASYTRTREEQASASAEDWHVPVNALASRIEARRAALAQVREELETSLASLSREAHVTTSSRTLAAGEVVLSFHPLAAGWAGFAEENGGALLVHRIPRLVIGEDPAALAAQLLEPVAAPILRARRLRILPYGPLKQVDFHALPWRGGTLGSSVPVVYGADLAEPVRAPPGTGVPVAVVVADSRGDLPAASEEGAAVARLLEAHGWRVIVLSGPAATRERVLAALEGTRGIALLHFAGHGASSGNDGWESGLALADGNTLSLLDVLLIPSAPRRVVLSACDAAGNSTAAGPEGLSLANAFLAAGSEIVVAATSSVADRRTATMMSRLYGTIGKTEDDALADRLQIAYLLAAGAVPAGEWAKFRVVVR